VRYDGHHTIPFQNTRSLQHKIPTGLLQQGLNVKKHQPSESTPFTTIHISTIVLNLRVWLQWTGTRLCKWPLLLSRYCTHHCQLSQTQPLTHNSDLQELFCIAITIMLRDRDSSVSIATRYRLDSPGIEPQWGWNFPQLSRPTLGTTQPPIRWVPGLSLG
jgi:hypothetical protein